MNAGPLSMTFDRDGAFLRHVRFGDVEVVRGVFAAIRDQDWNTIPFTVHDFELDPAADSFTLQFLARCDEGSIRFDWKGTVTGTAEGVVRFKFDGEAVISFMKNRIGLCVLHPIQECAGRPCEVEHTDGSLVAGEFPRRISPHQPFKDLRAITHEVRRGVRARVSLHGEVFEMEDQRNWTDASFKTYSTPLDLPFPVEIQAGSTVAHEVTIELLRDRMATALRESVAPRGGTANIAVNFDTSRPPAQIGLGMATCEELLSESGITRLSQLQPHHLRVDLKLDRQNWLHHAQAAIDISKRVGCALEVALFATSTADVAWQESLKLFRSQGAAIARWLVFHADSKATPQTLAQAAHESLSEWDDSIPIVVGTEAYFAELNRHRPKVHPKSQVCYSINPQVHAFDNLSMSETLGAHRWTVDSARELFSCPVVVSPVTLRPRFNPNATSIDSNADGSKPETDARQITGFAAAWTVGALSQLTTHPGVASVTFYETHGPRGVMYESGNAYPVFHVFESVFESKHVCEAAVSHPLEIAAIGLMRSDGSRAVIIGNMSDQQQTVIVNATGLSKQISIDVEADSVRILPLEAEA